MSSIGAVFNFDGRPIERHDMERMANALARGTAERRKILVRGPVGLVHCLRVFTPEDRLERQPIIVANRWCAVFEGRIDNRDQLAREVGIDNDRLRSMADGDLFGAALERWGLSAFERIVGEFAGILFDLNSRQMVVFRDHVGMRSLVYYANKRSLAVATTLNGLFALSWVPKEVNFTSLTDRVAGASWNVEATDFEGIFSVPPAHFQTFSSKEQVRSQYWSMADLSKVRFRKKEEYAEALKDILTVAVGAQLRAVGEVGSQVTGGLDSSSVAVTAAHLLRQQGKKLHGFTAVPEEGFRQAPTRARYFDETEMVLAIAEMAPNLEPHFVRPSHQPILERIEEIIRLYDSSFSKVLNNLWSDDIIRDAGRHGVRVLLNGEGGNLTISYAGWPRLAELFLHGHWLGLRRELRHFPRGARKHLVRMAIIGPLLPRWFYRRWRDRHLERRPLWSERSFLRPEFGLKHRIEERADEAGFDLHYLPALDEHQARVRGIQSFADGALSLAAERAFYGIDARAPALDRRVIEYTLALPTSVFLGDGMDRRLIRDAMRGALPEIVRNNLKVGDQAPDWFARLGRELEACKAAIGRAESDADLNAMFDFQRLQNVVSDWSGVPPMAGTSKAFTMGYSLPRAICVAKFVAWAKGTN